MDHWNELLFELDIKWMLQLYIRLKPYRYLKPVEGGGPHFKSSLPPSLFLNDKGNEAKK